MVRKDLQELQEIAIMLQKAAERCEQVADSLKIAQSFPFSDNIQQDEIAEVIANLIKHDKAISLREWLDELERKILVKLIEKGTSSRDLEQILDCSNDAVRQYFHTRRVSLKINKNK